MSEQENNQVSIGKKLHDARIAKKYTLDDLQNITKIQKRYLLAIEEDQFDDLPGDFYVRAFVKQYADTVDLNGDELLKDYNNNLPDTNDPNYVDKVSENRIETRNNQNKGNNRYSFIRRYLPIASVIIIVLVIVVAVWMAASKSDGGSSNQASNNSVSVSGSSSNKDNSSSQRAAADKHKEEEKQAQAKAKAEEENKMTIKKISANGSNTTYQIDSKAKSKVINISSADKAWIGVRDNNQTVWQGSQEAGASHDVKLSSDTKNASISLGNALKNTIKINGEQLKLDNNSQVQSITLEFNQ